MQQVTNMNNVTYKVGMRVQSNDGWNGTITHITNTGIIKLHVLPDNLEELPKHQYWKLNPEAAKMAGKAYFCLPFDQGQTMGNFKPI